MDACCTLIRIWKTYQYNFPLKPTPRRLFDEFITIVINTASFSKNTLTQSELQLCIDMYTIAEDFFHSKQEQKSLTETEQFDYELCKKWLTQLENELYGLQENLEIDAYDNEFVDEWIECLEKHG